MRPGILGPLATLTVTVVLAVIAAFLLAAAPACAELPSPGLAAPAPDAARAGALVPRPARPKIALVLSGGGARGIAHVGVLKVLEELRVPVDVVVGTSMGAIVGGLYASGYTPAELEKMVSDADWARLFTGRPARQELTIRRKEQDFRLAWNFEVGVDDSFEFGLPRGAVGSNTLELFLHDQIAHVADVEKFDSLPTPFRAVATDMESGEPVVFSSGPLHRAMRASMSIPGAFAPIEIDKRLIGDGGLVDNLPVALARSLGADVVIAVNVGTPLAKRSELGSVFGIALQSINILIEQNVRASLRQLTPSDILMSPDLGRIGSSDFERGKELIAIGEAAARALTARMNELAMPEAEFRGWLAARARPPTPAPTIAGIRFSGARRTNPELLASDLSIRPGEPLDRVRLNEDLRRLIARGDFEAVDYRLLQEVPGDRQRQVVYIDLTEKSYGPHFLRAGMNLATDFAGDAYFNVFVSHQRTWINRLGGEWRNDLQLGRTRRFSTEFYQPIALNDRFFVGASAENELRRTKLYAERNAIAEYQFDGGLAYAYVGAELTKWAEGRVGLAYRRLKADPTVGLADFPSLRFDDTGVLAKVVYDQLDSASFPRDGTRARLNLFSTARALGADQAYSEFQFDAQKFWSWGKHTVAAGVEVASYLGSTPSPILSSLGGFLRLSGYKSDQLRGSTLGFGRLVYYQQVVAMSPLGTAMYVGGSLEAGDIVRRRGDFELGKLRYAGSLLVGFDTPLGPLYIAYGLGSGGNRSAYLFLGRP